MGLIFHVVCKEKKLTGDACYFRVCLGHCLFLDQNTGEGNHMQEGQKEGR